MKRLLYILLFTLPFTPIDVPGLISPSDGASICSSSNVTLMWSAVTGATEYTVKLGATVETMSPFMTVSSDYTSISTAFSDGIYYWTVRAINSGVDTSAYATPKSFTQTCPPAAPGLQSPAQGSTVMTSSTILLSWGAVSGVEGYDLYVGPTAGSMSLITSTSQTYWSVTLSDGTWWWSVKSYKASYTCFSGYATAQDFTKLPSNKKKAAHINGWTTP